jgi:hypothetical protein
MKNRKKKRDDRARLFLWFIFTFATSAVEGLHSFNAHHNQPRVTVDVHNQPDRRRWWWRRSRRNFLKKEQASDDLIERFVFFFFKREREINNIFEGRRHVIGQSTGAHAWGVVDVGPLDQQRPWRLVDDNSQFTPPFQGKIREK